VARREREILEHAVHAVTEQVEARRAVQLFNEHVRGCPICDDLENVFCDEASA
jgi:hypothetical protein